MDRIIRLYKELGPNYCKLNSFTRIKPAEYRLIATAVTDDGLTYGGEVIALEPENAPKLAVAVEALRGDCAPQAEPGNPAEQAFAKAEKAMKSALAEYERLHAMRLDYDGRSRLRIALDSGRQRLELIRTAA